MPDQHDVRIAIMRLCRKYCLEKTHYDAKRSIEYQECIEDCLDIIEPLEELLKDIVIILNQHGKEIGRIEIDLSKVMRKCQRHAYQHHCS